MIKEKTTNIHESEFQTSKSERGGEYRHLDLSGKNIGVRIEELLPGSTSSDPHFHTVEEEHVLVLAGSARLKLGSEETELKAGDHVCFSAGEALAHHIINHTSKPFRFLVFGERKEGDVVFYPDDNEILVKALGWKRIPYRDDGNDTD